LVVVHHHRRPTQLEAERDLGDLGRLQGVADQDLRRLVPADDVDLLAAELLDDVLDPAAADADARADRVDLAVDRADGDLRAVPGSRASALISIVRSPTSGTSRSNSRRISSGWLRLRMIFTALGVSRTSMTSAWIRSPGSCCSPGICSLRGMMPSTRRG
jgi:hypothetical protein